MEPVDAELQKVAEGVLRSALIDELLSIPEFSIRDTYDLKSSDVQVDVTSILDDLLQPSEPYTYLLPVHKEDGSVDFVESNRDADELSAPSSSMALNRTAFIGAASIKGSSSNVPFYPGGFDAAFDNVMQLAVLEDESTIPDPEFFNPKGSEFRSCCTAIAEYAIQSELLVCAPGMSRGMDFASMKCSEIKYDTSKQTEELLEEEPTINLQSADIFDLIDFIGTGSSSMAPTMLLAEEVAVEEQKKDVVEVVDVDEKDDDDNKDIQCALEVAIPSKSQDQGLASNGQYIYAKVIDVTRDVPEYSQQKEKMAKKYPFDLDPFQQAAVVCMEEGESMFVAAHTSAGKTVVAEYAIALCKKNRTRAIYTSPIKALSNQKFRDFKMIFDDVGLVTGDIQLYPEAFCLIMTTEILRSMLYNGSEVVRDLEWVVFDEVHYINNAERGHVWEEKRCSGFDYVTCACEDCDVISYSAKLCRICGLGWNFRRIKNRRINVVSTMKRPVPLEHFIYTGQDGKTKKNLFPIVNPDGTWNVKGYNDAIDSKKPKQQNPAQQQQYGGHGGHDQRGRGGRGGGFGQRGGGGFGRGGGGGAGGGQRGGGGRGGGNSGGNGYLHKNDKNVYINLIDHLRSQGQLPTIVFVFSRKRCDDNAQMLNSIDLTTNVEKEHVNQFFKQCITRLKGSDKELPQVLVMRELCKRGFAVHHSGILPILKEVVELLFQKGFVKLLFATETFAMGVNMPARTVVFDSVQKHDGQQLRPLNAGEYIQMAGRAGRRGLDSTGMVIIIGKGSLPEQGELQMLTMGKAAKLESQFRVTYSMLLNLLRVEQLRVEDMLQRSYVESASLRQNRTRKNNLEEAVGRLSSLSPLDCALCSKHLLSYHDSLVSFLIQRQELWTQIVGVPSVAKQLDTGRLLIVSDAQFGLQHEVVVLLKLNFLTGGQKSLQVLVACDQSQSIPDEQKLLADEFARLPAEEQDWRREQWSLEGAVRFGLEGVAVPQKGTRSFRMVDDLPLVSVVAICRKQLRVDVAEVLNEAKLRMLPRFRSNPISEPLEKLIREVDATAEAYASEGSQVSLPGRDLGINQIELITSVKELIDLRELLVDATVFPAKHCAQFYDHMTSLRDRVRVQREVDRLQHSLSTDSLLLSDDYQARLKILSALNYVESGNMVSLKGRVACEIHHQELLISELILENKLFSRTPAEVAAMLSATTCQYKNNKEVKFEKGSILEQLQQDVLEVSQRLERTVADLKVRVVDIGDDLRFDLMEVVYNWANGMSFAEIMTMTEAQEGLIVRCIQRLGEVCKDVRNAARIVGEPGLHEKMEQVSAAIKRDIVFAASLYTSL